MFLETTMTCASYSRERVHKDMFMVPELHDRGYVLVPELLQNKDDLFTIHAT
jgi:hypothetical protein